MNGFLWWYLLNGQAALFVNDKDTHTGPSSWIPGSDQLE